MLTRYPDYYDQFTCLAGSCPDTCCGQWEIVIDEKTYSKAETEALGIAAGDFISFDPRTVVTESGYIKSRHLDDKASSAILLTLAREIAEGLAREGVSIFTMNGGSLTSYSGALFYCTNTSSVINLSGAELVLSDTGMLLIVSEGRWGKDGRNGGKCTVNVSDQILAGDIYVDDISELYLNLTNVSYEGAITGEGHTELSLGEGSSWVLTADSYLDSLTGDTSGIDLNGFSLYVDGEEFTM